MTGSLLFYQNRLKLEHDNKLIDSKRFKYLDMFKKYTTIQAFPTDYRGPFCGSDKIQFPHH